MNLFLGLFFTIISAILEEKSVLLIEKAKVSGGLLQFIIQTLPAQGLFLACSFFFIIQSYFLKESGVTYGIILFAVWFAVVVGLLMFDSPDLIRKSPLLVIGYLLGVFIIFTIQLMLTQKQR